jgi:hypothetical protein
MNTTTDPSFASIELGAPQVHRNIVVFPILSPSHDDARWLTLGEALEQQLLTVTEVSQGGSVPELAVINRADRPVLLLDGEELIGAKQNRVLNTTILLKEHSETIVPVSCTEHGRWSYISAAFADSKVLMAHRARAHKSRSVSESLAASAGYQSDQGGVWQEIAALHSSIGSTSPTGAMHDAYKARERELDQCVASFSAVPGQTGLLVVIDDQVAGFDLIPHPEIYARQHTKLVKSYLIDSIAQTNPRAADPDAAGVQADEFLRAAAECPVRKFPSIGYGTDCRYRSAPQPSTSSPQPSAICGSALMHEEQIVHAAFFSLTGEAKPAHNVMRPLAWRRSRRAE